MRLWSFQITENHKASENIMKNQKAARAAWVFGCFRLSEFHGVSRSFTARCRHGQAVALSAAPALAPAVVQVAQVVQVVQIVQDVQLYPLYPLYPLCHLIFPLFHCLGNQQTKMICRWKKSFG